MSEVTRFLKSSPRDDPGAADELLRLIYGELRKLAAQKMAQEAPGQTLQATALVHEAWLRLGGDAQPAWENRAHFFAAAAEAMRRILIENARRKNRLRHGGGLQRVDLDQAEAVCGMPPDEFLAVNEALSELEKLDAQGAQIVKLRFFAGLTHPQIADGLNVSLSAVERSWAFSRVWLFEKIRGPEPKP